MKAVNECVYDRLKELIACSSAQTVINIGKILCEKKGQLRRDALSLVLVEY